MSVPQQQDHRPRPPPLPPRHSLSAETPPPYSVMTMSSQDPRSSSAQSLVPNPALDNGENASRRRLLLVYIHGFMGNETSFRSFPAHVHNLVTLTLADTHLVHTKIYPRYRSRNALEMARDDFSAWLAPHEDQWTDVILLGHSMGGLLAADIALVFRHRILGIINFDVPFLGMHPGIVKAGLGSLFSPAPAPQDTIVQEPERSSKPSRISTLFNPQPSDPNYNPSFTNDVQLPMRKGWDNTLHWLTKHYKDGLKEATKGLVKSHFEFGGAMADYRELKERYANVRALEEEDDEKRSRVFSTNRSIPRVRFVNYYTASTGRAKKPKAPQSPRSPSPSSHQSIPKQESSLHDSSIKPPSESHELQREGSDCNSASSSEIEMTHVHPDPMIDSPRISLDTEHMRSDSTASNPKESVIATGPGEMSVAKSESAPNLPEIPPIPKEPPFVDLLQLPDRAARKAAETEHERALKEYQKAVKARNKIINERAKLEEKWEKHQAQDRAERQQKSAETEMRESEARQRQAEAEQRKKEAESRMSASERKASIANERSQPAIAGTTSHLEEDLGALDLGVPTTHPSPRASSHYDFSPSTILSQAPPTDSSYPLSTSNSRQASAPSGPPRPDNEAAPKKLKKFCMLPPHDAQGNQDPAWIRVLMPGVDEVTAHTTLFFVNETYERLVGDVGARIETWTMDAESVRLVRELSALA